MFEKKEDKLKQIIRKDNKLIKESGHQTKIFLIAYYGILQTLHLLVLIRAGVILLLTETFPFPILPLPGGWASQAINFMVGLGFTDTISILLGIAFAYLAVSKDRLNRRLGVISLTIFITGAVAFALGTFPTGAWAAHPFAYGAMVFLFLPTPYLQKGVQSF